MSNTEKTRYDELDILFEAAKNIKPKHNLTAEQMDVLNEKLFG